MAEEKKDHTGLIIAAAITGGVGLAFVGFQQGQREDASNTANLPATNAKVDANSLAIDKIRSEGATIKYVDTLDRKKQERVDAVEQRVIDLENRINSHQNFANKAHHTHTPEARSTGVR